MAVCYGEEPAPLCEGADWNICALLALNLCDPGAWSGGEEAAPTRQQTPPLQDTDICQTHYYTFSSYKHIKWEGFKIKIQ